MRIWQIHELGEPIDRLQLDEVDAPEPGEGEAAIAVDVWG